MHQMDNDVNVMKVNTIKKILGDLALRSSPSRTANPPSSR